MKKHIKCHYKNGALLFCTAGGYHRDKACQIMEVFSAQKLTCVMQPSGNNLFRVVGRLNMHYDPFATTSIKWDDVLAEMNSMIHKLEENLKPFYSGSLPIEGRYVAPKLK